jgi:hypothetical protein
MDGFVSKPIDRAKLDACLNRFLPLASVVIDQAQSRV